MAENKKYKISCSDFMVLTRRLIDSGKLKMPFLCLIEDMRINSYALARKRIQKYFVPAHVSLKGVIYGLD